MTDKTTDLIERLFESDAALTNEAARQIELLLVARQTLEKKGRRLRTENERLRDENLKLSTWLVQIEPQLDSLICYASTTREHPPNRIVKEIRDYLNG